MYISDYENIAKENAKEYYTTGEQKLSDSAFDALIEKIKKEKTNSDVLTVGWGYNVEENSRKLRHKYGLVGSLTKVHNWEEIKNKIDASKKIDISAKLDGLSAVIYFKNGVVDKAITRGNGEFGVDITDKIKYILNKSDIPDKSFTGAVRGELTMPVKEFEEFKQKHPEAKNSRNSTAGLINGDEITEDYKYIKFVVYSIIGDEDLKFGHFYSDFVTLFAWFENNFENVAPRKYILLKNTTYEDELKKLKDEWSKIWFIDGVVLSNNNIMKEGNKVIQTSCAFKFEDETAITTVIGIDWNMSKNSEMIPVLEIEPVELEGTTVKRVTAFNAKFVEDNKLAKGAVILICKRNQIIPYVMEVIKPAVFPALKVTCPYCDNILLWDDNHIHIYCDNENCPHKKDEDLKAICMNLAPIDGLGWKTINKLLTKLCPNVSTLSDILAVNFVVNQQVGTSELSLFTEMLYKIQNDHFTVSQFLLALNIPGLGKISANNWESSEDALACMEFVSNSSMSCDDVLWTKLVDILKDKNVAMSLKTTYNDKFRTYFNLLKNRITVNYSTYLDPILAHLAIPYKGTVVVTGSLNNMTRKSFEELLKSKGWKLANTISKSVDYLITNTPNSGTSKNKKADELNVVKITEEDFIKNCL